MMMTEENRVRSEIKIEMECPGCRNIITPQQENLKGNSTTTRRPFENISKEDRAAVIVYNYYGYISCISIIQCMG